jgi:ElaB/YqjD/DUF883 family membrane-anchored ribosome-binding protein
MAGNDLISKGLKELEVLRTELEQTVKTASEGAKEGWQKLRPRLEEAEKKLRPRLEEAEKRAAERASHLAHDLGESADAMITDLRGQLEKLRDRIRKEGQG